MNLSDLLAAGTEVSVGGEVFRLRKPTLGEEAAFSKWLKDAVKREAGVLDPQTPEDAADRMARAALRDIGGRYYEPPAGPGYVEALSRPDGMAEMIFLILKTDHPKITRDAVRTLIEEGLAREWVRVIELEKEDPKVVAAVLGFLGLPPNWLDSSPTSSSESETHPSTGSPGKSSD